MTSDAPTSCPDAGAVTCGCRGPSDCDSGICADYVPLTPALYGVIGNHSICTKPCCTSFDCTPDTVCFGAGTGGNYCVLPKWIGRTVGLGLGRGGATCSSGAECRSGLCNMGTCADTCCSTAQQTMECATGTVCRYAAFPGNGFDTHETAWCSPSPGGAAAGATCGFDTACQSGKCAAARCMAPCRTSTDCTTGLACSYGLAPTTIPANKDIIEGCVTATGPTPDGGNCTANSDCQSAFCDGTMHCTDACVTDADCKTGLHCRLANVMVQGTYTVLACES